MNAEQVFSYANLFALLGWLPLLFAPVRRPACVAAARWAAALLAGTYVTLIVFSLVRGGGPTPDFTTLAGLAALFGRPEVLLIGWVHYLAFDLWVGSWITEDAGVARVPHVLVAVCLVLTFVAGPVGLLSYLLLRAARRRRA